MSLGVKSGAQSPSEKNNIEGLPEAPAIREGSSPSTPARGIGLFERFADDQRTLWTSPFRLQGSDAVWLLSALSGTGALFASDSWLSRQVPAGEITRSRGLSNYGALSLAGAGGGMFLVGKLTRNDHAAETGFLAGEAAVNAVAVDYALKSTFQRQRPYQGAGSGRFFAGGSSFPSEHATASWAIAGVIAHEYPGRLTQVLAYGLASAVTVTRVTGKEHFPSDAVIGSALGYFIARQIYNRHRDPEVGDTAWGSTIELHSPYEAEDKVRSSKNMGSSYLALDSWVYASFERLAALGYMQTDYLGIRPWTRMECARLLDEADDAMRYQGNDQPGGSRGSQSAAEDILAALRTEFADEIARRNGAANAGARLDSLYTRFMAIAGRPLRDGYHFGQTVVNDYGRPYGEGFNQVSGLTGSGVAGPFSFSIRGEYQHAPAVASDPPGVLAATAAADGVMPVPDGSPTINQFRLLEGSIGLTFNNVKVSFGKQNLWLGPGESGSLLMSDNAAPITMLQIDNVSPVEVPLFSRFLGPVRMTSFIGQLSGQTWVYNPTPAAGLIPTVDPQYLIGPGFSPQPFLHGNKISFRPSSNLEFGLGVTAIFGGPGLPFTWHEFFRSYYGHNANTATNPAKRFSSFDLTYRVPGLRNWLTLYTDSMVGDEISPLGSTRPMLNPGVYFPQLPRSRKLELRVEGFKADPRQGTMYIDRRYHSGYTNDGNLIGSWIGRQALGGQAWLKYSFSARTSLQFGYRHQEVDHFLVGGGRANDFSATADCRLGPRIAVSGRMQYEQWNFPALSAQTQANFTAQFQLTYFALWGLRK